MRFLLIFFKPQVLSLSSYWINFSLDSFSCLRLFHHTYQSLTFANLCMGVFPLTWPGGSGVYWLIVLNTSGLLSVDARTHLYFLFIPDIRYGKSHQMTCPGFSSFSQKKSEHHRNWSQKNTCPSLSRFLLVWFYIGNNFKWRFCLRGRHLHFIIKKEH